WSSDLCASDLTFSHSYIHTHTHTLSLSHSFLVTHSLSLSFILTYTHTLSLSFLHTHILSLSFILTYTHTLSLSLSLSLSVYRCDDVISSYSPQRCWLSLKECVYDLTPARDSIKLCPSLLESNVPFGGSVPPHTHTRTHTHTHTRAHTLSGPCGQLHSRDRNETRLNSH